MRVGLWGLGIGLVVHVFGKCVRVYIYISRERCAYMVKYSNPALYLGGWV